MTLQEIFAKYSIDDEGLQADMEQLLNDTMAERNESQIPKSRFDEVIAQRNEVREQLQQVQTELEGYSRKLSEYEQLDIPAMQEEKERLAQQVADIQRKQWEKYEKFFEIPEDDPRYERMLRIREDFRLGSETEPLSAEDIRHNLEAIKPYIKAGYFTKDETYDNTRPIQGVKPRKRTDLTDMFKAFGG